MRAFLVFFGSAITTLSCAGAAWAQAQGAFPPAPAPAGASSAPAVPSASPPVAAPSPAPTPGAPEAPAAATAAPSAPQVTPSAQPAPLTFPQAAGSPATAPAAVPAQRVPEPPPPIPAPDPTVHRHDGFYLRLGLGGGFFSAGLDAPSGHLSARGGGLALDLSLGGTVADGLVIGGGLWVAGTQKVHWEGDAVGSRTGSDGSIGLLGVFADYYPDPKGGFHVEGALGIGTLTFSDDRSTGVPPEKWSGGGGGALLGVGYEFWVGDQWSLGGLTRVIFMSGSLRGEDSDVTFDARGFAPSLLFVATHH